MKAKDFVQPGDTLLYYPKGIFGWLISIKTWHEVAHCEGYVGNGMSVASRDGIGVGLYPLRLNGLVYVLRPKEGFFLNVAMSSFARKWRGQGYDWLGLLRFAWRAPVDRKIRFNNRQFCSEFLTRWNRAGGVDPFNGEDADAIAPFQFLLSPVFDVYVVDRETGDVSRRDS